MEIIIKGIHKNFKFAFVGIIKGFNEGPIIKFITLLGIIGIILGFILKFTLVKFIIIIFGIAVALALELMNSAIESVVDATKKYNKHTEDAKDMSSGSVLLFGIFAVFIAIMMLF